MNWLSNPRFLPTTMVVISVLASAHYAVVHDWRHMIYWLASATLIAAVTY